MRLTRSVLITASLATLTAGMTMSYAAESTTVATAPSTTQAAPVADLSVAPSNAVLAGIVTALSAAGTSDSAAHSIVAGFSAEQLSAYKYLSEHIGDYLRVSDTQTYFPSGTSPASVNDIGLPDVSAPTVTVNPNGGTPSPGDVTGLATVGQDDNPTTDTQAPDTLPSPSIPGSVHTDRDNGNPKPNPCKGYIQAQRSYYFAFTSQTIYRYRQNIYWCYNGTNITYVTRYTGYDITFPGVSWIGGDQKFTNQDLPPNTHNTSYQGVSGHFKFHQGFSFFDVNRDFHPSIQQVLTGGGGYSASGSDT